MSAPIGIAARPYLLTFESTGETYPLDPEAAIRLVGQLVVDEFHPNHLTLRSRAGTTEGMKPGGGERSYLYPAAIGGGPAFEQ